MGQIDYSELEVLLLVCQANLYREEGKLALARSTAREQSQATEVPYAEAWAYFALAFLCKATGDTTAAISYFKEALASFQHTGYVALVIAVRSYLAASYLAHGDLHSALPLSTQAVTELEQLDGGEHPQAIYLHHWRILQAASSTTGSSAAVVALEKAHATIQAHCKTLPEPAWQHDFLTRVQVNRE